MAERELILVTGATGRVGREVVSQLLARGARVRGLTRHPDSAALPVGVDVIGGDLSDPASLPAILDSVDAVFLLWPFFTAGGVAECLTEMARHPRRVVFLSAMGARDDHGVANTFHGDVENQIESSGLEWTFLRAGGFAANTLAWAEQIRSADEVRWSYGGAARSLVHERDIAAVAVHTLTGDGHAGATYTVTGPEALTQADQVRIIGEAIGRTIRWEEIPPEATRDQLLTAGMAPAFVDGALDYWAGLVDQPEPVTTTVERLTAAPAHTFAQWATHHAEQFR